MQCMKSCFANVGQGECDELEGGELGKEQVEIKNIKHQIYDDFKKYSLKDYFYIKWEILWEFRTHITKSLIPKNYLNSFK